MRKNFGAKEMCYPMPVFIIGTYNEDGTPNAMNAAWGGISEENLSKFSVDYDEAFGFEADLHPKNIIDNKHFEIKTPDVVIKVDPARSDLIETRILGGIKYIMICADENVEVNGVSITIRDEEKETAAV